MILSTAWSNVKKIDVKDLPNPVSGTVMAENIDMREKLVGSPQPVTSRSQPAEATDVDRAISRMKASTTKRKCSV
jgi:glycine cleavage system H lipoate-binding protein